jgi:hypothetical protein
MFRACLGERWRAKQAADVIGAERRSGQRHLISPGW